MKILTTISLVCLLTLTSGCAEPLTDAQVQAVAQRCKELGMSMKVFNGLTSFAECQEN